MLENDGIIFKHQNTGIKHLYDQMVAYPQEEGVFGGMSTQYAKDHRLKPSNKNKSDPHGLFPLVKTDEEANKLYHRKQAEDFGEKHNIPYVAPPLVKEYPQKNSFIHFTIGSKPK